jgi:hypothetical protein
MKYTWTTPDHNGWQYLEGVDDLIVYVAPYSGSKEWEWDISSVDDEREPLAAGSETSLEAAQERAILEVNKILS